MIYDASPTTIENCGERIVELENSLQALLSLKFAPEQCLQRLSSLKSGSQSVVDSIHQFIADASKSLQETHSGQELRLLWTQGVRASEIAKAIENAYKKCMHRSQREEEGMILKHKKRQKETDEETDDINPPKRRIAAGRRRIMTRPLSPSCKHRVMETKLASMETLALNHGTDPQAVSAELTYRQCQDDQDVADVDGVTRRQFQAMTRENTRGQSESCGDEDPLKELMERFLRTRLAKSITFR